MHKSKIEKSSSGWEKNLHDALLSECKKIELVVIPEDEPASNTEAVNGNPTTQPPPPIGDIGNAIPPTEKNTSNNGQETERGLSKILRILTSCEQKVKTHLDDSENGRLYFKKFADEIIHFKTNDYDAFIAASASIKRAIASAEDKINQLNPYVSNLTEIEKHQFVDFKTKVEKHDQALIYIAEIGKWCERIIQRRNRILPNDKKSKLLAVSLKNLTTVNGLASYKKSHRFISLKPHMPKHQT